MAPHRRWNKKKVIQEIKNLQIKLKRKPMKRDNSSLYFLTRKFFGSWNNAMKKAGFEIKIKQKPNIPNELSNDLAYFLGLLITDGHIAFNKKRGNHTIMIFTSFKEERDIVLSLIKNIFNYRSSFREKKYGFNKYINYEIRISSKELSNQLVQKLNIPAGAKSKVVRVPFYLFKSKKGFMTNFLRGVIDGDGSISKNRIKISSGSIKFLEDIKLLLNNLKISSGLVSKEKNKNTFNLCISSKDNFRRLCFLLYKDSEFFYPRKKLCWERYLNTI